MRGQQRETWATQREAGWGEALMDHVEGGVRVSRGLAALPGPEDAHNSACSAGRPRQLRDPDKSPSPAASELTGYVFLPRNQLPLGPDAVPEVPPAHCPLEPSPAAECTPSRDCAPSLPLPCLPRVCQGHHSPPERLDSGRFLNDAIYLGRCSNCWFLTAEWGLERVLVFPPVYFIVSH